MRLLSCCCNKDGVSANESIDVTANSIRSHKKQSYPKIFCTQCGRECLLQDMIDMAAETQLLSMRRGDPLFGAYGEFTGYSNGDMSGESEKAERDREQLKFLGYHLDE